MGVPDFNRGRHIREEKIVPSYTNDELAQWFSSKAKDAQSQRRAIFATEERARSVITPGKMIFFKYQPKGEATLKYFDRYPLVLPIKRYGNGFLGLNIHYLDYPVDNGNTPRLLKKLHEFATNNQLDSTTKVRLSYNMLKQSIKTMKLAKPTIKRYLLSHVRSRFIEVHANEWEMAAALPVQLFHHNNIKKQQGI
jgi:hypothetical protein